MTVVVPMPIFQKPLPLHTKILLGLVIGAALGLIARALALSPDESAVSSGFRAWLGEHLEFIATQIVEPLGKIFLRLIIMMVVPLVVSALALGVADLGKMGRLGRIGGLTLLYTIVFCAVAVMVGILFVSIWQPGNTLSEEQRIALSQRYHNMADDSVARSQQAKSLSNTILDLLPENPLQEAVGAVDGSSKGNGMLALMVFALLIGAALSAAGEKGRALIELLESLFAVSMTVIGWAINIAPYGVACLLFSITVQVGLDILVTLFWFLITALAAMAVQMLVVYPLALRFIAGRNPWQFFRQSSEVLFTAFGTSSSSASLPVAIRVADKNLKLPSEISHFVLTIGSTGNQNGTAIYAGMVVLFLAQVFQVDLTFNQQMTVFLMSLVAGIGTAGIPGGSIPLVVIVMQSVGIPGEGIGIVLGVDRILDMCRTALNVAGDMVIAACVSKNSAGMRANLETSATAGKTHAAQEVASSE